jgi:hypothetical protein
MKWHNWIICSLIVLMFVDEISTIIGIFILKIATEENQILVFLWNHYGIWGSLLKFGYFDCCLVLITYLLANSHNKKIKLIGIIVLIVFAIGWAYTDFSNLNIILH